MARLGSIFFGPGSAGRRSSKDEYLGALGCCEFWLASVFFAEVGVVVEFVGLEPEGDFFFGFLFVAAGVDKVGDAHALGVRVTEAHVGVVTADGAHFSGLGFGGTDNLADEGDGFDAFKNHSDDGTGHHVVEVVAEGLFAATSDHFADFFVVGAVVVFVGHNHFHADDFETDALETLE